MLCGQSECRHRQKPDWAPSWLRRWSAGFAAAIVAVPLAGCGGGVLDPRGPVGAAIRLILFDSLTIMLAIVVPVILATLGFAWWFRRLERARLLLARLGILRPPRTDRLGHPGAGHHLPRRHRLVRLARRSTRSGRSPRTTKPVEIQVVSLDWKWLFIYPGRGRRERQPALSIPVGAPVHFRLTSSGRHEQLLRAAARQPDLLRWRGMTSQLNLQADEPGTYRGFSAKFSGEGFSDMHFDVHALPAGRLREWIADAKATGATLDARPTPSCSSPART